MRRITRLTKNGIHRSRNGLLFGVCRGIAERFELSLFWTRTVVVLLLFFTGFWPILILYVLAALIMKPEPVLPIRTEDQEEFYNSYVHSRKGAAERLKRRYSSLDRRIQRMEHMVTTREFDWERRLHSR